LADTYDYLTIYGGDLPTNTDGSVNIYDGSGNISDPILAGHLEDAWVAQNEGDPNMPFDLEDPYVTDWIDAQVDLGTERENDFLVQEGRKDVDKVVEGMVARGEIDETEAEATRQALYSQLEMEVYYGGDSPVKKDDFGFGTITVDGNEVADMNTFTDEAGTSWELNRDTSFLTETAEDGTTAQYRYKDGNWYSVREYSDAYKKIAGTDFKETKLTDDEVASKGFNGIDITGTADEIDLFGDEVSAPSDLPTYGLFTTDGKTYIKSPTGAVEYDADIHDSDTVYNAWASQGSLDDTQKAELVDHVTRTDLNELDKALVANLIEQGDADIIGALGGATSDIGRSGDGTRSGDRSKFTNVSQGEYITIGGQIYEVTGKPVSMNYKSKGRKDGDVKAVSKNHYAQAVEVTDPITGKTYELQSIPSYDQGHVTSSDLRDTSRLPKLYL
jgi:hypothetical protein